MSPEFEKKANKLVSILANATPAIGTRKKAVETAEIAGKDGEKSKSDHPENLVSVSCIRYPITFRKKSMPMLVLFDSRSEINAIHPIFA